MFPLEQAPLEFLLIGAVALVVIGPKDLPIALRRLGQFVAKMRSMAAEVRSSLDELARQSELEELRREVDALRHGNYSPSTPPDPAYAYKPYDNAAAGLDSEGAPGPQVALPEAVPTEREIVGEGVPPAAAEYPVSQRPPRPRGKRPAAAAPEGEPTAEAASDAPAAPPKPVRKPRSKKTPVAKAEASPDGATAGNAGAGSAAE